MDVYPDFREFFVSLNRHGVDYVIIGGYAMAYHGVPRATKDIDLLIHANPANAKNLVAALGEFGFEGYGFTDDDFAAERFFFRMGRSPQQIDLLTTMPGVTWDDVWRGRMHADYGGVAVDVIGREQFIQAKRAAGRPEDLGDLSKLGEL